MKLGLWSYVCQEERRHKISLESFVCSLAKGEIRGWPLEIRLEKEVQVQESTWPILDTPGRIISQLFPGSLS